MAAHEPWTDEEYAALRLGIAQRKRAQAIGEELGRSAESVRNRAHVLGLKWDWTPEELSEICSESAKLNPKRANWAWGHKRRAEQRKASA